MPKFILPEKHLLLEDLHAIDLRTKLEGNLSTDTFSTKSVYIKDNFIAKLTAKERELFSRAVQLMALEDGQMIPFEDAARQIALISTGGRPLEIVLAGSDFFEFLVKAGKHPLPADFDPNKYEKKLHFYLGKRDGGTDFNMVIVPAFEKEEETPTTDHYIEARSFNAANPFFAYIMSDGIANISEIQEDCKGFVLVKDTLPTPVSATQVVSFSYKNFTEFNANLILQPPTKFFLQFGRIHQDGNLVIILSFLDGNGPIRSRITTPASQGVCFDKGDLIPPPNDAKDWDSSLI